MSKKGKVYPNPQFSSLEEEEKYWATHSPLEEGYDVKVQRPQHKLSSFLTVRLTGDELTKLRDIADKNGIGPSTYARLILKSIIERGNINPYIFSHIYDSLIDRGKTREDMKSKKYCILEREELTNAFDTMRRLIEGTCTAIDENVSEQLMGRILFNRDSSDEDIITKTKNDVTK